MISKQLMAASTRPIILAILAGGEDYGYSIIQKVRTGLGRGPRVDGRDDLSRPPEDGDGRPHFLEVEGRGR